MSMNPFAVLGLPEWPDLEDATVRAAWRAIAAETHPGREDGGDLARYAQAFAAYTELRDQWGRSEAYAELVEQARRDGRDDDYPDPYALVLDMDDESPARGPILAYVVQPPLWLADPRGMILDLPYRFRHGHRVRILIRAAIIAGLCLAALAIFPRGPAEGIALCWLIVLFVASARADMAPLSRPVYRIPPPGNTQVPRPHNRRR